MNFVGPGDFQFVTGDLSFIEIDNDIMPKRSASRKYEIRGMDIAFLMEAIEERARAIGNSDKSQTFSKTISAGQTEAAASDISRMDLSTANYRWYGGDLIDVSELSNDHDPAMAGWIFGRRNCGITHLLPQGVSVLGNELIESEIHDIFSEVGKFKNYVGKLINTHTRPPTASPLPPSINSYGTITGSGAAATKVSNLLRNDDAPWASMRYSLRICHCVSPNSFAYGSFTKSGSAAKNIIDTQPDYADRVEVWGLFAYSCSDLTLGDDYHFFQYSLHKISDTNSFTGDMINAVVQSVLGEYTSKTNSAILNAENYTGNVDIINWVDVGLYDIFPALRLRDRTRWD